jgi:hypothetical protein
MASGMIMIMVGIMEDQNMNLKIKVKFNFWLFSMNLLRAHGGDDKVYMEVLFISLFLLFFSLSISIHFFFYIFTLFSHFFHFTAFRYGPPEREVTLLLLDVRYFRETSENILGREQWDWFHTQLRIAIQRSHVIIIASGIQIFPSSKPISEKFGLTERRRLLHFLQEQLSEIYATQSRQYFPIVLLLSGDVHYAELMEIRCPLYATSPSHTLPIIFPITELTTSGLTHSIHYHFTTTIGDFILEKFLNTKERLPHSAYGGLNYATLHIDWQSKPIALHIHVRDRNGQSKLQHTLREVPVPHHNEEIDSTVLYMERNQVACYGEESTLPIYVRIDFLVIFNTIVFIFLGSLVLRLYLWIRAWLSRSAKKPISDHKVTK